MTIGILSASSWTRVPALIAHAGLIGWAVRVQNTLWTTSLVRIAHVICKTSARTGAVLFSTLRVGSARRWNARCAEILYNLSLLRGTHYERISNKTRDADAVWCVADCAAFRIGTAASWAGIFAFLVYAGEIGRTLAIANAFGSAVWRRTYKAWQTGTRRRICRDPAF